MIEVRKIVIDGITRILNQIDDGPFQSFCLDFLPFYNNLYEGLQRHGGTVEGKTRKGTPDLIKTLDNGDEIAVQCSTLGGYWNKPTKEEDFDKWKPISDIKKCVSELTSLKEIVLCSNREIPTNLANVKSEIIQKCKSITNAKITILDRAEIERVLFGSIGMPFFKAIAKVHFPEISFLIEKFVEARANELAIDLRKEKAVPFDDILKIAHNAVDKIIDSDGQKIFALNEIKQLHSSFQRIPLPNPGSIERKIPKNSCYDSPCGIIQVLTGVPQIGKTYLGAQLSKIWETSGLEIRWFECPFSTEQRIFIQDLSRDLWELFLSPELAHELSLGNTQHHSIKINELSYRKDKKIVYVIDNSERLEHSYLKQLCELLSLFKKNNHLKNVGVFFLTNKGLKHLCHVIDSQLTAPAWSNEELIQFLSTRMPEETYFKDEKYIEILKMMSSGHPVVALALAQKYPSSTQLLLNSISGPSLGDEDLAIEIKQLLFNELVQDSDFKTFIIRLSQLTYKANSKVLLSLSKIVPAISTPITLIIEGLMGTVIEGSEDDGYGVSFVYKEVAKKQFSKEQQKELFDAVSLALLAPEGKSINAKDAIEGVFYSILAGELERAFFWSTMMAMNLSNAKLTDIQISSILDRISFLKFLKAPEEKESLMLYYGMLMTMALAYARINDKGKALSALENIKLPQQINDEAVEVILRQVVSAASLLKLILLADSNPNESVKIFISIDVPALKRFGNVQLLEELARQLMHIVSIKDMTRDFICKVFEIYKLTYTDFNENLIDMATSLGLKGSSEKVPLSELLKLIPEIEIKEILNTVITCQYYLEDGLSDAVIYAEKAIALFRGKNLQDKKAEEKLLILLGDVHYKAKNPLQACEAYQRANNLCVSRRNFDYAWINWRLGLISENPMEAENYFKNSFKAFLRIKITNFAAKSCGEKSVALVQQNKYEDYADLVFFILKKYYIRNDESFAPTAMVAMAQVTRLTLQLEKKPIIDSPRASYPDFKRGVFNSVLDIAKPNAGGGLAFYALSLLYGLLGCKEKKLKCLLAAINFTPVNEMEEQSSVLLIKDSLEELLFGKDYENIFSLMLRGIKLQKFNILSLPFISLCVFSGMDKLIVSVTNNEYSDILNLIDKIITTIEEDKSIQNKDWWLAELYSRKFRINQLRKEDRRYLYKLAKTAYDYGLKSNNTLAIIEGGNFYGYPDVILDMKALAEIHFNIMTAVSAQNLELERLQVHGSNLSKFWSKIKYNRLSVDDLQVKKIIWDNSRVLLQAGLDYDAASPIMLLLLASLYSYHGEPTKWAVSQIKKKNVSVPSEVAGYIATYLEENNGN